MDTLDIEQIKQECYNLIEQSLSEDCFYSVIPENHDYKKGHPETLSSIIDSVLYDNKINLDHYPYLVEELEDYLQKEFDI